MSILVTGATGFIGSNTCVELIEAGYEVVGIDNLSNSYIGVLDQIEKITNKRIKFYEIDLRDNFALNHVFNENKIVAVIHFAALKSVSDSYESPLTYYDNNINGTISLLTTMEKFGVRELVFSSSATVYAPSNSKEGICENDLLFATNPYGKTKLIIEDILRDLSTSNVLWKIISLRYFNPVGAHHTGLLGENPIDIPKNLVPNVANVASGRCDYVKVYGDKYATKDGTGARDYIHVTDLARGHIAALNYMKNLNGFDTFNLGVGRAITVLELIKEFEEISGQDIPYMILENRIGDVDISFANNKKAREKLQWSPKFDLKQMCYDSWAAIKKNDN
jgi:UDP-glucose 4-epimerase